MHRQVQSKVGLKYDAWHKEVVSKFGNMLGNEMVEFHSQVSKVCSTICHSLTGCVLGCSEH